jgi:hypothetical protein
MSEMATCVVLGVFLWAAIGAVALSAVDKRGELLTWLNQAPSMLLGMLAFTLWPVMIAAYLWPHKENP